MGVGNAAEDYVVLDLWAGMYEAGCNATVGLFELLKGGRNRSLQPCWPMASPISTPGPILRWMERTRVVEPAARVELTGDALE